MDMAVANRDIDRIDVFPEYGDRSFVGLVPYSIDGHSSLYSVATDDVNEDNRVDIVVVNNPKNTVDIFLEYRNGSFSDQMTHSTPDIDSIIIGNVNKDNRSDCMIVVDGEMT